MKRLIIIIFLFCSLLYTANGQEHQYKRLTFGAEWGYIAGFFYGQHQNFYAPEGFRVNINEKHIDYFSNAEAYLHIGCNISEIWNISLYAGIAGVMGSDKIIPVSIRGTHFFGNDPMSDRWFSFIDVGSGISINKQPQEIIVGKLGGGYRISLSRNIKMDFVAAVRTTFIHPQIVFDGTIITQDNINRNNVYISAVSAGISLTF